MARPAKPIDQTSYSGRFAARLRMLREKQGLTGEQMAEAITRAGYECTLRAYYLWESSNAEPPLNAIPAIAGVFGIAVRTVFPTK